MKIAIAGPYSAPTGKERQDNLDAMNEAAAAIYERGHIPIIGVNAALPVLEKSEVDDEYKLITDISMAIVESCDAMLFLGESPGANRERDKILEQQRPVYRSLNEIPEA
ncbi:MAG: DUF4406 domain-containing protein [Chitinophagales bacterium]|nr:DUF4406 domain-containing protein [Chitinophagales bacterium]